MSCKELEASAKKQQQQTNMGFKGLHGAESNSSRKKQTNKQQKNMSFKGLQGTRSISSRRQTNKHKKKRSRDQGNYKQTNKQKQKMWDLKGL